jgi:hypothetical protein
METVYQHWQVKTDISPEADVSGEPFTGAIR